MIFFSKGIEHVPETVGTGNKKDEAHTLSEGVLGEPREHALLRFSELFVDFSFKRIDGTEEEDAAIWKRWKTKAWPRGHSHLRAGFESKI